MTSKLEAQREKRDKHWNRLDSIISRNFSASNMSNTKWVKLLKAACSFHADISLFEYKLVYSDEVNNFFLEEHEEHIDDYWFQEPIIYKELEWVEFSFSCNKSCDAFESTVNNLAKFPVERTTIGLRVLGYAKA